MRDRIRLDEFGLTIGGFLLDALTFALMTFAAIAFVFLLYAVIP